MHRCSLSSTIYIILSFMKCIDLKPDNIGYSSDGTLKLMDFGLSTCVRARINVFETYAMTGFTGSLRYMAPEVVRSESYTEKADMYGFGLLLYQLITNKLPYNGMNKATLIEQVINNNQRPKIKQYIPSPFFNLLTFCWHRDPNVRPSFEGIKTELALLSSQLGVNNNNNAINDHAGGDVHSRWSIFTFRRNKNL